MLPDVPVPISLAALAPASIRLAGELADEWAPFLWARSRIGEGRALLAEGEARAASSAPTHVSVGLPVALGPRRRRPRARRLVARHIRHADGTAVSAHAGERFGMREAVAAVAALGDRRPELPAVAEELAEEVTLMATHDRAGDAIGAWLAAGADSVSLVLPPGRPEAELTEILEVAADAVAAPRAA